WATSVASHRLAEPNSAIISMAESPDGKVWLGTRDKGLFYMVHGQVSRVARVPSGRVTCLLPMEDGKLWVGTEDGVMIWDGVKLTLAEVPSALRHTRIFAMMRDHDSNVWVGTAHGLSRYNSDGISSLDGATPAAGGPVTALFEDRE